MGSGLRPDFAFAIIQLGHIPRKSAEVVHVTREAHCFLFVFFVYLDISQDLLVA